MSGSVEATLVGYGLFISVGSYCLLASNVRELPWIFPRLDTWSLLPCCCAAVRWAEIQPPTMAGVVALLAYLDDFRVQAIELPEDRPH
jgi:hypothetical protein